ncbi:MAG: hypothetical protein HRT98_03490 [Mycoplasmatales bacterium]|nr:hypothetical protein [Mycoplasmatales bacterium]
METNNETHEYENNNSEFEIQEEIFLFSKRETFEEFVGEETKENSHLLFAKRVQSFVNIIDWRKITDAVLSKFGTLKDLLHNVEENSITTIFGINFYQLQIPKNTSLSLKMKILNKSILKAGFFLEVGNLSYTDKSIIELGEIQLESKFDLTENDDLTIHKLENFNVTQASIKAKSLNKTAAAIVSSIKDVNSLNEILGVNLMSCIVGDAEIVNVKATSESGKIKIKIVILPEGKGDEYMDITLPIIKTWKDENISHSQNHQSLADIEQVGIWNSIKNIDTTDATKAAKGLNEKASDIIRKIHNTATLNEILRIDLSKKISGSTIITEIDPSCDTKGNIAIDISMNTLGAKYPDRRLTIFVKTWTDKQVKEIEKVIEKRGSAQNWLTKTIILRKKHKFSKKKPKEWKRVTTKQNESDDFSNKLGDFISKKENEK